MRKLSPAAVAPLLLGLLPEGACFSRPHAVRSQTAAFQRNSDRCVRYRTRPTAISSTRQPKDSAEKGSTSKSGWHRRVTSVFRKSKTPGLEASSDCIALGAGDTDKYLANTFELNTPASFFPAETASILESTGIAALDPFGVSDLPSQADEETSSADQDVADEFPAGSPLNQLTRGWFENALAGRLNRWSNGNHEDLRVQCRPSTMRLLRGQALFDAVADFGRIVFENIRMSGGRIEAHSLALNLFKNMPRYPKKFDFVAKDVTFTEEDLFESSCIRNGLQRLLVRILKRAGVSSTTVTITQIEILPSNRVHIQGEATSLLNAKIPFAVRSGLASQGRGHVLTFPGLEVALSPEFGIYIPIIPEVTLDLGHTAQLLDVEIDGVNKAVRASARVTITPTHTRKVPYRQSPEALAADYSIDVGRWLTRIGKFSHA